MHLRPIVLSVAVAFGASLWTSHSLAAPAPVTPAASAAVPATPPEGGEGVQNSALDATLFYQLLISEVQARSGDVGTAYQIYLDAARRMRSAQLFQRAVDLALEARAGEQALAAAQAWRTALPQDRAATEYTAQILMALGRTTELGEPLASLIEQTPAPQRASAIAALPRSLARLPNRKAAAELVDQITARWRTPLPGMAEAWAASSEAWLSAGDHAKAFEAFEHARKADPKLLTVGLLAIDLMGQHPAAEAVVKEQSKGTPPLVLRLAYARKLAAVGRLPDAGLQLQAIVKDAPDNAGAWLTLAAVRLELRQLDEAEAALRSFLALKQAPPPSVPSVLPHGGDLTSAASDIDQGYLLMAQVAELRKKPEEADEWLRKADPASGKIRIQAARAKLLALNGKLPQARALLQSLPETEPRDALDKINAEAQLLRDMQQVEAAYDVLAEASKRFADDPDLLYDQAMLAERLKRWADSERLLRRVIEIKADHPHAYNALGYSLADRGQRLDEARTLINKALELRPGDPFITDSLGWLEFRAGRHDEALKWLRQAYLSRPDAEIAAHLGEVLWVNNQRDEALRIWREGMKQDAENSTLAETLKRLKVTL